MVVEMPTITLKNIPAGLHRRLKKRAEEHHRSMNKEIIATLKTATGETQGGDAVSSNARFEMVASSSCTGYDCEFVVLALEQRVRLLSVDPQILREIPEVAISLERFVRQ